MSATSDTRSYSQRYLEVVCPCGRRLRASVDAAGSTIQCWECKATVPVPIPRAPRLAARVLFRGLCDVFSWSLMSGILAGALVLVGLLILPLPGRVQVGVALALLAIGYGEVTRRGELASIGTVGWVIRGLLTLPIALLPMLPSLVLSGSGGMSDPPALVWPGVLMMAGVVVVVPLLLLTIWTPRRFELLRSMARHPFALVFALAVVPLGLVAAEAVGVLVTSWLAWFSYYVVALYPRTVQIAHRFDITSANYSCVYFVDAQHLRLYQYYLIHGIPLSSALPASLNLFHLRHLGHWTIELDDWLFLLIRAVHTAIIAVVWLTALTIQAYWLGLIARLDLRLEPTKVEPTASTAVS